MSLAFPLLFLAYLITIFMEQLKSSHVEYSLDDLGAVS